MRIINPPFLIVVLSLFTTLSHSQNPLTKDTKNIPYIPLGDSYTICQGANLNECWTELITIELNKKSIPVVLITNPARSGWTTRDLIEKELPLFEIYKPDFTTLLIGVNDWIQGVPAEEFRKNFSLIIDRIQAVLPDSNNIVIITIPDFSSKPEGEKYSKGKSITTGLTAFNEIIFEEAAKRKLTTVDLFKVSQQMKYDKEMIAPDGLHPSAKEYAIWVRMIFPAAFEVLKKYNPK